jgi:hypothetical protein
VDAGTPPAHAAPAADAIENLGTCDGGLARSIAVRLALHCSFPESAMKAARQLLCAASLAVMSVLATSAAAEELPEYRLKAAFLYNFIMFTEWPTSTGGTLNLCIYGSDPFGAEIDAVQGKAVDGRRIAVQRKNAADSLKACQIVFVAASAMDSLPRVLTGLRGQTVLTVADSTGAMHQGVALNMAVRQSKVSFEANVPAARNGGVVLSSKLLRLATEVEQ